MNIKTLVMSGLVTLSLFSGIAPAQSVPAPGTGSNTTTPPTDPITDSSLTVDPSVTIDPIVVTNGSADTTDPDLLLIANKADKNSCMGRATNWWDRRTCGLQLDGCIVGAYSLYGACVAAGCSVSWLSNYVVPILGPAALLMAGVGPGGVEAACRDVRRAITDSCWLDYDGSRPNATL